MFYPLEQLIHLHDGYRRVFRLPGAALLLLQENGQRYLIKNVCPHKDFPLHESSLNADCLQCPYHGLSFDLRRQGRCVSSPNLQLTLYPIAYDGKFIGVEWSMS